MLSYCRAGFSQLQSTAIARCWIASQRAESFIAVIARAHFDTVQLPHPPAWLQKAGLALGAPLGRHLGYGDTYTPAMNVQPIPEV